MISKTKVKLNKQCRKLLYLEVNHPKLKVVSENTQQTFDRGRVVEKLARDEYGKAKIISGYDNAVKLAQTNFFLKKEPVIFEASFLGEGIFVQVDILVRNDDGTFDAIEVKSGTKISDEYFEDVLIQHHAIKRSNTIKIKNYYIWYVNKNSTSLQDFFIKENIIDKVDPLVKEYEDLVLSAQETMSLKQEPSIKIGPQCDDPYECPFKNYCFKDHLTNPQSVLNLPALRNKWKMFHDGIEYLSDERFPVKEYKEKNPTIYKAIMDNSLALESEKIMEVLSQYKLPLFFFDVETVMTPVPFLKGQRPYQQMVVQYSIHKLNESGLITQIDFLHESTENPEKLFVEALLKDLEKVGDIVVYNKTFESTRIKELAEKPEFAEYKDRLYSVISRFKDLLDVIKKYTYHPDFGGSFSLKAITPAILTNYDAYANSTIKSGNQVSDMYESYVKEKSPKKKETLKQALLQYNRLDTLNVLLVYLFFIENDFKIENTLSKIVID